MRLVGAVLDCPLPPLLERSIPLHSRSDRQRESRGARGRPARQRSREKCASTPARAPSTPRMPRTTARCRSAWCCRATPTTSSPTVAACREHGAPILRARRRHLAVRPVRATSRWCSTSPSTWTACSRWMPAARTARVEPGVVCDTLRDAAEHHGLTFGPDPATHSRCTLGGMIGNNSCGAHSVMAGKTVENIEALEVLTYDGARFWVGPTSETELDAHHRGAAAGRARSTPRCAALRDRYADLIRATLPEDQAPRLGLQPRSAAAGERLQRRARAGRQRKAPARSRCRRRCASCKPARARAAGARLRRHLRRGRRRAAILAAGRSPRGPRRPASSAACGHAACKPEDIALLPAGRRLADGRVRRAIRAAAKRTRRRAR